MNPTVVARVRHDPAVVIEYLEADGLKVERQSVAGVPGYYRVAGTIGDRKVAVLLVDDDELYLWWQAWWFRGYHERYHAAPPAKPRRRRRRARARVVARRRSVE